MTDARWPGWPFLSTDPRVVPQPAEQQEANGRAPMLRATHTEPDMLLPAGRTCADCRHFGRCNAIYGHIAADEVCDWAPSRFAQRVEP